eukprot:6202831-Pleurochrysis_carterae.AAC.2
MLSWSLTVAITLAVGGWRSKGHLAQIAVRMNRRCKVKRLERVCFSRCRGYPFPIPGRSGSCGTTLSRAASAVAFAARGFRHCHQICKCSCVSVEIIRSSRVTGSASAKIARFSSTIGDTLNTFKWLPGMVVADWLLSSKSEMPATIVSGNKPV